MLKYTSDEFFMALVIWREARGEPLRAQIAVGFCILDRVNHPKWWGHNIMDVIRKRLQFSSMTDPRDKQLTTWPGPKDYSWDNALQVAAGVISGGYVNPADGADSYHDISIPSPKWAEEKKFVAQIGRLKFYNVDKDIEAENGQ